MNMVTIYPSCFLSFGFRMLKVPNFFSLHMIYHGNNIESVHKNIIQKSLLNFFNFNDIILKLINPQLSPPPLLCKFQMRSYWSTKVGLMMHVFFIFFEFCIMKYAIVLALPSTVSMCSLKCDAQIKNLICDQSFCLDKLSINN